MRVLTLLNECGGVGKTTLATHLAAGLALRGLRVVLIDADAQGTATIALGNAYEPGLSDLLVKGARFSSVLRPVDPAIYVPHYVPEKTAVPGAFQLLPSDYTTQHIPTSISSPFLMRKRLKQLESTTDVVIFDTSPTPSLLHGSIYLASDGIVYPTKPEFNSIAGLVNSLNHLAQHQEGRVEESIEPLKVLGIVPTMYRAKTAAHVAAVRDINEEYSGQIWPTLTQRTAWVEAGLEGKLIYAYEPNGAAAKDMAKILNACLVSMHEAFHESR